MTDLTTCEYCEPPQVTHFAASSAVLATQRPDPLTIM